MYNTHFSLSIRKRNLEKSQKISKKKKKKLLEIDEFVVRFAYKQAVRRHQSYVTRQLLDTTTMKGFFHRTLVGGKVQIATDPLEKRLVNLTRRPWRVKIIRPFFLHAFDDDPFPG